MISWIAIQPLNQYFAKRVFSFVMFSLTAFGQNNLSNATSVNQNVLREVSEADLSFPSDIECVPQLVYRHRPDWKAGREITLNLKGAKLFDSALLTVECEGLT